MDRLWHNNPKKHIHVSLVVLFLSLFIIVGLRNETHPLFSQAAEPTLIDDTPVTRSVLLLIFNPILETRGGQKLTQYRNWSDPDALTNQVVSLFPQMSNNYLTYAIQERQEIDGYFIKQSGYEFTDESYLSCTESGGPCNGELIDYQRLFTDYDICNKNVDEVWLWGAPWFGYQEYNPVTYCGGKTTFVMGFSYERQLGEALHDFGHRMEFVGIRRVGDGNWQQNEENEWNKYSLINGHCGNIHYTPRALIPQEEYIYDKSSPVDTDCDGYNTFPTGPFTQQPTTCSAWGCSQHGYVQWWLSHIPHNSGTSPTIDRRTIYNNWWKYYAFYDETIVPLPTPSNLPTPTPTMPTEFTNLSSALVLEDATFNFGYAGPPGSPFVVDMSLRPDMSWDTYLTFGQGSASPVVVTNPEKWASYTCGTDFYWTVKNAGGTKSAIQHAVVDCSTPTPTFTPTPSPTPTLTPTPTPPFCQNMCGNGICEQVICSGPTCACVESIGTCPVDCQPVATPTPTTIPSPTKVVIYALGKKYQNVFPTMELRINEQTVATWQNVQGVPIVNSAKAYTYTHPVRIQPSDSVRVALTNDPVAGTGGRDLQINKITIAGRTYQTEAATTYSTGTWKNPQGCAPGFKKSEWLHCNGYLEYAHN